MSAEGKQVYAGPTKRFFVSMLTRDIDLSDAILDLVDNCVDGAMRSMRGKLDGDAPFANFRADLCLNANEFKISDNCGGIPNDFLEDAFTLGRPNLEKDADLPTIGMYGIGMKRAIFKMGREATISTQSYDGAFKIEYSNEWLDPSNDDEWKLPVEEIERADRNGVTIHVKNLREDIGRLFADQEFVNQLHLGISQHFGYIITRGFEIAVNGNLVRPQTLSLFNVERDGLSITPFDYVDVIDDVEIRVTVGFFRQLAREAEIDDEAESPRTLESSGVSVICNDRVILFNDRTLKTGWGDGGVPRYHPQFRAIAGLVMFYSPKAEKLPVTTTKRGLDVGSDVYLTARKALMEGLKAFTDFTNKWKGMERDTDQFFVPAAKSDVRRGVSLARSHGAPVRSSPNAKKWVPRLPVPDNKNPRRRVTFVRREDEIKKVSLHLFDESDQHPSVVGAECFDRALKEACAK